MFDVENDEDRTLFKIPANNMKKFEAQIEKLSRRSMKLIGEKITPVVFSFETIKKDGREFQVYDVLLSAQTPRIDGWTFVARIDHSQETGNIVRAVPNTGIEIPEIFRTAAPNCQHCNHKRQRRDTFVVHNDDTGEFKQIGSTCLIDFFGHDPSKIARMAELLGYAFEAGRAAETDYDGYPSFSLTDLRYIELDRFLQHVAWAVRRFGWVSGSAAFNNEFLTATKSIAISNMFPTAWDRKHNVIEDPIDADIAFAAEAHEWARTFALKDNLNDYEHNVLVIAEATYIEYRSIGLAASIVGVHFRNSEKTKADALKDRLTSVFDRKKFDDIIANSPFMGQPGDKVKNLVVEVIGVKRFEFSMLLKLLTEDGHVLSWFATSFEANLGDRVVITSGTIREHKLYEGNRETNLTRCRATKVADA